MNAANLTNFIAIVRVPLFIGLCIVIGIPFFLVGMEGCSEFPQSDMGAKSPFPKLESQLYELSQAENPAQFAENSGLCLCNGEVRVIIELADASAEIPHWFNIVSESQYGNLLQAMVPITELGELSNEPYIKFIRAPLGHVPAKGGTP